MGSEAHIYEPSISNESSELLLIDTPESEDNLQDVDYSDVGNSLQNVIDNEHSDYDSPGEDFDKEELDDFTFKAMQEFPELAMQEFPDIYLDEGFYDDLEPTPIYRTTSRHWKAGMGGDVICPVRVNQLSIDAILDTGAQFTVVATRLIKNMPIKPKPGKAVKLVGINSEFPTIGYWAKVKMEIGKLFFGLMLL